MRKTALMQVANYDYRQTCDDVSGCQRALRYARSRLQDALHHKREAKRTLKRVGSSVAQAMRINW